LNVTTTRAVARANQQGWTKIPFKESPSKTVGKKCYAYPLIQVKAYLNGKWDSKHKRILY
jgi:hypothetical protein